MHDLLDVLSPPEELQDDRHRGRPRARACGLHPNIYVQINVLAMKSCSERTAKASENAIRMPETNETGKGPVAVAL